MIVDCYVLGWGWGGEPFWFPCFVCFFIVKNKSSVLFCGVVGVLIPRQILIIDFFAPLGCPCFCVTFYTAVPQHLPRRNNEIIARIGVGYWESSTAKTLFSPSSPDDVRTDVMLSSHIE